MLAGFGDPTNPFDPDYDPTAAINQLLAISQGGGGSLSQQIDELYQVSMSPFGYPLTPTSNNTWGNFARNLPLISTTGNPQPPREKSLLDYLSLKNLTPQQKTNYMIMGGGLLLILVVSRRRG
jgi:hypothetical protein